MEQEALTLYLLTGRQRTRQLEYMNKTPEAVTAEEIARMADRGQDISHSFKGEGRLVEPIQRVNVDITADILPEEDKPK